MSEILSRRRLLALLPAAASLLCPTLLRRTLLAQTGLLHRRRRQKPAAAMPLVYIGTDTFKSSSKGIYGARFNAATGQLSAPTLAAETVRPSYLASARVGGRWVLYAANEGSSEHDSGISSYTIDPPTGALSLLNKVASGGAGPCYVSVDGTASSAFAANYAGSSVASFKVQPGGALSEPMEHIDFKQAAFGHHGPNSARQDGPHPHSATISPDNRFLVVNDLGNDDIVIFPIHTDTARLGAPSLNASRVPGSGPRHVAFHPNGRWVYGVDELTSKADQYLWNATHGGTSEAEALLTNTGNTVSTLDASFHEPNTAAEIVVTPDGDSIIVSNRGENSLVVFNLDAVSGAPKFLQRISCGGKAPRQFTLDSTGKWLLCGNQDSGSITVFARDENSNRLSGPVQTIAIEAPQMILFA